MSFAPANLQWVGVAREVTPGTPIAAPTMFVPTDSPTYHLTQQPLVDTNLRGSMAGEFEQIAGMQFGTVTFKTNCYLDQAYFLLRTLLGYPDQVTGSSDQYTHQTALQNTGNNGQPVSTTVFWTDAAGRTMQMPGAQASSVKVTIKPDQLVQFDVTYIGLPAIDIAMPTNTPQTALPAPSWNTIIEIGGNPATQYSEISMEYKRATEPIMSVTGSQAPYAIFGGPVTVAGSMTSVYQGNTDINWVDFLANTQPVLSYKIAPVGDATHYIEVVHSKVAYDDVQVSGTNKWMEVKSTIKALGNTTDDIGGLYSPAHVTLLTAVSTAI